MNRRTLGALAIIIIVLMGIVATAGLDNLPRQLRNSVAAASTHLNSDRAALAQNQDFIDRALRDEPVLFRSKADAWRGRLAKDQSQVDSAAAELTTLQQLAKANRRTDTKKVTDDLARFDATRQGSVRDSADMRAEAERWMQYKKDLPQRLEAMKASYETVRSFDPDAAAGTARKAMVDWPAKRDDLQSRLDALKKMQTDAATAWESSAQLRTAAEAKHLDDFDYGAFFEKSDQTDNAARALKDGAASLNTLAGQLYVSWDKLLEDVDKHDSNEKVRIVRTQYKDATLTGGQTSSEEKWQSIDSGRVRDAERNVGMVIERKPAGKYDSEAERTIQPPAYAYMAPPGQSNQYGSWSGGVWHWLPEYLILSHLLRSTQGPSIGDYYAWDQARRRGETWYGHSSGRSSGWNWSRNSGSSSSGSGTGTGWYKERPKFGDSSFGSSSYRSRGTFSGSRFQSRGTFGSRSFGGGMRSFGRGGRR
jgi:hypothetical protein